MSYKVSKDYPRLKKLLDEGYKVVCWVTYERDRCGGCIVTDIAEADRLGEEEYMNYNIKVREYCFWITFLNWLEVDYTEEGMYKEWKALNLQFIDPDPSRNTLDLERAN